MKIIFLDIDGVLNGYGIWSMLGWKLSSLLHIQKFYRKHSRDPFGIHEEKVKRLGEIVSSSGAKVVMTSSGWRNSFWNTPYKDKTKNQKMLVDLLNKYNIDVIDITPFTKQRRRDKEILLWLAENEDNVDSFIILDDERSDLQCFANSNLVQTSKIKNGQIIKGYWYEDTGLKRCHVKKAINMLNV